VSYGKRGQKRGTYARNISINTAGEQLQRERRIETMIRNNRITEWAAVNRGLRGQENLSEERGSGGEASTELESRWWFEEGG